MTQPESKNVERIRTLMSLASGKDYAPEVMAEVFRIIESDAEARQFYIRQMHLWSAVSDQLSSDHESVSPILTSVSRRAVIRSRILRTTAVLVPLLICALIYFRPEDTTCAQVIAISSPENDGHELVVADLKVGAKLDRGTKVSLTDDVVEFRFLEGARVVVSGPAEFEILDTHSMHLVSGEVCVDIASSTSGNHGFRLLSEDLEVVDLGTRFGLRIDKSGQADIHVFDGSISFETGGTQEKLNAGSAVTLSADHKVTERGDANVQAFAATYPRLDGVVAVSGQLSLIARPPIDIDMSEWFQTGNAVVFHERSAVPGNPVQISFATPGRYVAKEGLRYPSLPAGGELDSFVVRFRPVLESSDVHRRGSVTFDRDIVGVIAHFEGLVATDQLFGYPDLDYSRLTETRGALDFDDALEISRDRRTISFDLNAPNNSLDGIRVLLSPHAQSQADSLPQNSSLF